MAALLLLSYAAFVTFVLVPTAPPWWASANGYLDGVRLIHLSSHTAFLYDKVSPNSVAAMPSLHAAYPWLFFLFACRLWGKRGGLVALYPAAVFFAVVYLGHHYVVDIIGGIVYASASYALVCGPVGEWVARLRWLPQRRSSPAAPPVAASTARS
jgi:membrane-associated phospholipid phosphatase